VEEFDIQGAKLSALNQATAYRGICTLTEQNSPSSAEERLESIRQAVKEYNGIQETNETLWESTSNPTLQMRVQQYLYVSIHESQMVGSKWANVPSFQQRQICDPCLIMESMDHITMRCQLSTTRIPWEMAKAAWPYCDEWWLNISLGIILGIGCIKIPPAQPNPGQENQNTHRFQSQTQLLQILISEMAHLVWIMRCGRVIQEECLTDQQIKGRWLRAINDRLTSDQIITPKS
jgi:hypothetical protein